jgi:hypothetical protein
MRNCGKLRKMIDCKGRKKTRRVPKDVQRLRVY